MKRKTHTLMAIMFIASTTIYAQFDCGTDSIQDIDGNWYQTVQIADQCWMAENLRTTRYANGTPIPHVIDSSNWDNLDTLDKAYCYYNNDSVANAETYGALYTWAAAMNGASSSNSNPGDIQGICPHGWHLPSDDEWSELESTLDKDGNAGSKLADRADLWEDGALEDNKAFGTSGFNALPAGHRFYDGDFVNKGFQAIWWSSRADFPGAAYYRAIYSHISAMDNSVFFKETGFSVRCMRDSTTTTIDVSSSQEHQSIKVYPNPFEDHTNIEYSINNKSHITIAVFSMTGVKIDELLNTNQLPGTYKVEFHPESSGIYMVRIVIEGQETNRKILKL